MGYREQRPPSSLAGLVECGWVDVAASGGTQVVLPDGCMDLVWAGGGLLVAGPDTHSFQAPRAAGSTSAGLRFRPGALPSLLGVPAAELHDRRVPLVDVLAAPARAAVRVVEDRLAAGEAPLPGLAALVGRLPGAPPDHAVVALRRALGPEGSGDGGPRAAGSVAALADALGCTPRSVHRRCLTAFGYGPTVLRRVLRFRRAVALLRAGVEPAEAAAQTGYADQPHLSREVRSLAGTSPRQLVSSAAPRTG